MRQDTPWPEADVTRTRLPQIPTVQLPAGLRFFHGTSVSADFKIPRGPAHFTTSRKLAIEYAVYEGPGTDPRILRFRTTKRISRLIFVPSVVFDKQGAKNAIFWLSKIFGQDFSGLGHMRVPEAFNAICEQGFTGLFIRNNDGADRYGIGADDIMLCQPEQWLMRMGETAVEPRKKKR